MVAQTSLNQTNGADSSPPQEVARNTGELLSDAMTLAELQGKLLLLDVQSDLQKLIRPIAMIAVGALVLLASLPIGLATLGMGLIAAGLEPWIAFLISFAAGLVIAGLLVGLGVWYLFHGLSFLERSRNEWDQNRRWFKGLIRRLGDRRMMERWRP